MSNNTPRSQESTPRKNDSGNLVNNVDNEHGKPNPSAPSAPVPMDEHEGNVKDEHEGDVKDDISIAGSEHSSRTTPQALKSSMGAFLSNSDFNTLDAEEEANLDTDQTGSPPRRATNSPQLRPAQSASTVLSDGALASSSSRVSLAHSRSSRVKGEEDLVNPFGNRSATLPKRRGSEGDVNAKPKGLTRTNSFGNESSAVFDAGAKPHVATSFKGTESTNSTRASSVSGKLSDDAVIGLYTSKKGQDLIMAIENGRVSKGAMSELILHASVGGNLEIVQALIKQDPKIINTKQNKWEGLPLHFACYNKHNSIVETLLEADIILLKTDTREKAINIQDVNGDTPFHIACKSGDEKVISSLARHLPEFKLENKKGETALDLIDDIDLKVATLDLLANSYHEALSKTLETQPRADIQKKIEALILTLNTLIQQTKLNIADLAEQKQIIEERLLIVSEENTYDEQKKGHLEKEILNIEAYESELQYELQTYSKQLKVLLSKYSKNSNKQSEQTSRKVPNAVSTSTSSNDSVASVLSGAVEPRYKQPDIPLGQSAFLNRRDNGKFENPRMSNANTAHESLGEGQRQNIPLPNGMFSSNSSVVSIDPQINTHGKGSQSFGQGGNHTHRRPQSNGDSYNPTSRARTSAGNPPPIPSQRTKVVDCDLLVRDLILIKRNTDNTPGSIWKKKEGNANEILSGRGNDFKVEGGIYQKSSTEENNGNEFTKNQKAEKAMAIIVKNIINKHFSKDEIAFGRLVAFSKANGGVSNFFDQKEGEYRKTQASDIPKNLLGSQEAEEVLKTWKEASREFQDQCRACGIYSGREASPGIGIKTHTDGKPQGLRLTFLPSTVINEFRKNDETGNTAELAKFFKDIKKEVTVKLDKQKQESSGRD